MLNNAKMLNRKEKRAEQNRIENKYPPVYVFVSDNCIQFCLLSEVYRTLIRKLF